MNTRTRRPARPQSLARRSVDFGESLAPYLPANRPLPAITAGRLSPDAKRLGRYARWVLAATLAGAGIGWLVISARPAGATTPTPAVPIAQTSVTVERLPEVSTDLSRVSAPAADRLVVHPASSVDQARAGNVWQVLPGAIYQANAQPEALQPGYSGYGFGQGATGTDAVIIR